MLFVSTPRKTTSDDCLESVVVVVDVVTDSTAGALAVVTAVLASAGVDVLSPPLVATSSVTGFVVVSTLSACTTNGVPPIIAIPKITEHNPIFFLRKEKKLLLFHNFLSF